MKRIDSFRLLLVITAVLLVMTTRSPLASADSQNVTFEDEVIRLVNLERISRGLTPLRQNSALTQASRAHNADMIIHDFFDHTGSNGSGPADRTCAQGYTPYPWGTCYVAENIAAGYSTPAEVVAGWMTSPGHRANMLNPDYREVGVGHNTGGSWGHYWTLDLGAQPGILPIFVNNDESEARSRQVTITLTREDVSSWGSIGPITGVQISEDPDFSDAVWQSWSQELLFALSKGSGLKTIYVKFTDGTTEIVSSDTINVAPPEIAWEPGEITFLLELNSVRSYPETFTLLVLNDGGGTLEWMASSNAWLTLSIANGEAPSQMELSLLDPGSLSNSLATIGGVVTLTATDGETINSPQTVPVTVKVVPKLHQVFLPLVAQ